MVLPTQPVNARGLGVWTQRRSALVCAALLAALLSGCTPGATIVSTTPADGDTNVARNTDISVEFSTAMDSETVVDTNNFVIRGSISGVHTPTATYDDDSRTLTLKLANSGSANADRFALGELVTVSLTTNITSSINVPMEDESFAFTITGVALNPGDDAGPNEFVVRSTSPGPNSGGQATRPAMSVTFDRDFRTSSASTADVVVRGEVSGMHSVSLTSGQPASTSGLARQLVLNLTGGNESSFVPGERVTVTLSSGIAAPRPAQAGTNATNESSTPNLEIPEGTSDAIRDIIESAVGGANQATNTGDLSLRPFSFSFNVRGGAVDIEDGSLPAPTVPQLPGLLEEQPTAAIAFGDFRPVSDGLELAVLELSGKLHLLRSDGDSWEKIAFHDFAANAQYMRMGDLDNDGHPELAIILAGPRIHIVEYIGQALAVRSTFSNSISDLGAVRDLELVDLDNDLLLDIAISHAQGVRVLRQVPDTNDDTDAEPVPFNFEVINLQLAGVTASGGAVEFGDLDEDGRADMVLSAGINQTIRVQRNLGNFNFLTISQLGSDVDGKLRVVDLDGDGDLDIVAGAAAGLRFHVNGGTIPAPSWPGESFDLPEPAPALLDFLVLNIDGDQGNRNDLVLLEDTAPTSLSIWLRGTNGLEETTNSPFQLGATVPGAQLSSGEFNADGGVDLAITSSDTGSGARVFWTTTSGVLGISGSDYSFRVPSRVEADASDPFFEVPVSASLKESISSFVVAMEFDKTSLQLASVLPDAGSIPGATVTTIGTGIVRVQLSQPVGPGVNIPLVSYRFTQPQTKLGSFNYALKNTLTDPNLAVRPNQVVVATSLTTITVDVTVSGSGKLDVESSVPGISELTCVSELDEAASASDDDQEIVSLEWTNNALYSGIEITRNGASLASLTGDATSYSDQAPLSGSASYAVVAFQGSTPSAAGTCTLTVIESPDNFTCERVNGSQVQLEWDPASNYTGYLIRRDGNTLVTINGGAQSAYLDSGADANGHEYSLIGIQSANRSAPVRCSVADGMPQATTAPKSVNAQRIGFNKIRVGWVNGENYDDTAGIELRRNGGLGGTLVRSLAGSTVVFEDADLPPATYSYSVTGIAGGVASTPATTGNITVVLPPPADVTCAVPGGNDVLITWVNSYDYDSLRVERTIGTEKSSVTLPGDTTVLEEENLAEGTYVYRVFGVYDDGTASGIESGSSTTCTAEIRSALWVEDVNAGPGLTGRQIVVRAQLVEAVTGFAFALEYDGSAMQLDLDGAGKPVATFPRVSGKLPAEAVIQDEAIPGSTRRKLTIDIPSGIAIAAGDRVVLAQISGSIPRDFDVVGGSSLHFVEGSVEITYSGSETEQLASGKVLDGTLNVFGDVMYFQDMTADPGDTIEVPVYGTFDQGIGAYTAVVVYDPSVLTCLEITNEGTVAEDLGLVIPVIHDDIGTALTLIFSTGGAIPKDFDQVIAYFVFEVNPEAAIGTVTSLAFGGYDSNGILTESTYFSESDESGSFGTISVGPNIGDLLTIDARLFVGDLGAPTDLVCAEDNQDVTLAWDSPEDYDSIAIVRDGVVVATIAGEATTYTDENAPLGVRLYGVRASVGALDLADVECTLTVAEPAVSPVTGLSCGLAGTDAELSWTNPLPYDEIAIFLDDIEIARLAGTATSFTDEDVAAGSNVYGVVGLLEGTDSPDVVCTLERAPQAPENVQCSVDENSVTIIWGNQEQYEAIDVLRDDVVVNSSPLAGTAFFYEDQGVPVGSHTYVVISSIDGVESVPSESCAVIIETAPAAPVTSLTCEQSGSAIDLTWVNGEDYDASGGIRIRRDNVDLATLSGSATAYTDSTVTDGEHTYEVIGIVAGSSSAPTSCTVDYATPLDPEFIRGDVNGDGIQSIADSTLLLDYISGFEPVDCADAADVNDDGRISIADGIRYLDFLFSGGDDPPSPYPGCGVDPTADAGGIDLGCGGPVTACD